MVRFGMRVGRCPHILEITFRQRRLVFRQRRGVATSRRCFTRAQAEHANRGAEKKEKALVTQWRWLLTVIHNPLQGFFGDNILGSPREYLLTLAEDGSIRLMADLLYRE